MTETFKKDPLETGGILLGHILDNGIWIVMEVLPPGWRSTFQYAYFEYDEQFVNYVAQNESKKYEQELQLLGLWHRHPGSMDTFSGTDDGTNRTFAELSPQGAISGLVNIDPRFRLTMYHCSNPLRYTKIEVEVGNDLIPKEYFKWKYYDEEKGRNPYPPEKKNFSTNTERQYGIESKNNYPKNNSVISAILKFLDKKQVFFLLFLVELVISLCFSYFYHKVKNTEDVKALHKIAYCVAINDSTLNVAKQILAKDFVENKAGEICKALKKDSLLINDTINRNQFVEQYLTQQLITPDSSNYAQVVDSLKTVYDSNWIEKQIEKQKEDYVAGNKRLWENIYRDDYYKKFNLKEANRQVKIIVIRLWIIAALLLLFAFAFALRKKDFLCSLFKKDTRFWFQKFPKLYVDEEKQIKQQFPNAEKNIENGVLSFFVETSKKIDGETVAFQLVYSDNYPTDKEIRVYLVNPDFEYLGDINDSVAETKIDKSGEKYLKFKNKTSGIDIIKKMYQLIALKSVK
jgi:hypothetical protein